MSDSNHSSPPIPPLAHSGTASTNKKASLSQWQLIRRRFVKHKLAVASVFVIVLLYLIAAGAEFFAPYDKMNGDLAHAYCPPQPIRFSLSDGLHIKRVELVRNPVTYERRYVQTDDVVPLGFFVKGDPVKLFGVIPMERHFFGVNQSKWQQHENAASVPTPRFYLFGGDEYGYDLFSRVIYGSRISLSIGLVGIFFTYVLGLSIGGVSGYVGGKTDVVIQRLIEIINSFPKEPLWMAGAALIPSHWSPLTEYFFITIVLGLLSWTGLARVVRGRVLALREEDYAVAARLLGANHSRVIGVHLLPGLTSHVIVVLTLSIPAMILGETLLSFLGLGLRAPVISWGVMLQDCMDIKVVASYPWILTPIVFVVLTVLSFNFMGDGMRDAADPYNAK